MDQLACIEQIRYWRESSGGLPLFNDLDVTLDDQPWGQPTWWEPEWWQSLDQEELVRRLLAESIVYDNGDPAERCFHVTSVWQQFRTTWFDMPIDAERRRRETLELLARQLLDERAPSEVREADLYRWEVIAAAEFEHWNRLDELFFSWRNLGGEEAAEAERAVARIKTLSCLIEPAHSYPELWLDYRPTASTFREAAMSTVGYCACAVGGGSSNRLAWPRPDQLSGVAVRRLYEARDGFERLEAAGESLTPIESALAAWCDAVIGKRTESSERLRRAFVQYSGLHNVSVAGPLQAEVDKVLLLTRARLSCWLSDYSQALESAEILVSKAADDPWAWELLAQIRRKLADDEGWVEAYERFIQLSPHTNDDWERTELLSLGLAHRERASIARLIAVAPALESEVKVTEAVVALDWPEFGAFCAETRERWLLAVTQLSNPRIAVAHRELRWAVAAEAAGEAVASELRSSVVAPLKRWIIEKRLLSRLARIAGARGPEAELARSFQQNRFPMGSIIKLLEAAKGRSGELGSMIGNWIDEHRQGILFLLDRAWIDRLESMLKVRNPATHGLMSSIDQKQALQIYLVAKDWLTELGRSNGGTP